MNDVPDASRTTLDIAAVQALRKTVLYLLGALSIGMLLFGAALWPDDGEGNLHEGIELVGLLLIIVAIVGRTWSSLYIAGRKKSEIVALGPYSVCRNPLYVFSFIGAAGAGAQFGSVTAACAAAIITILVFTVVVRKEERYLSDTFGETYLAYKAQVPRFIPDFSLWRNAQTIEIKPHLVVRTFVDACVFLAAVPVAESIEIAQASGILPVLWMVP